jgi:hypothetical protein
MSATGGKRTFEHDGLELEVSGGHCGSVSRSKDAFQLRAPLPFQFRLRPALGCKHGSCEAVWRQGLPGTKNVVGKRTAKAPGSAKVEQKEVQIIDQPFASFMVEALRLAQVPVSISSHEAR